MNFGSLRSHLSFLHKLSRKFSTRRFRGMSYPLEFTANQQEMFGRPGWPLFSDAEDNDCCDSESLQSSRAAELAPEPQSIGGKMKNKMLDWRTVASGCQQRLDGRKTSPVWRIGTGLLGPLTHLSNLRCAVETQLKKLCSSG